MKTKLAEMPEAEREARRALNRGYAVAMISRRREAGLCLSCGVATPTVRERDRICLDCWFGHMAKMRTGTRKNGPMLRELFERQGGLCAYTGERLEPGVSASLDHQMPVSRGGTNEPANLRWVTKRINSMKSDLTHDEFVSLCRVVGGC